jgi:hypothetical protein
MGLFSFLKTKQWNAEPAQQQLATLLGEAAVAAVRGDNALEYKKEAEVLKFLAYSGWKKGEAGDRIVHACSMVKIAGTPEVYQQAKRIGEGLYVSLGKAW